MWRGPFSCKFLVAALKHQSGAREVKHTGSNTQDSRNFTWKRDGFQSRATIWDIAPPSTIANVNANLGNKKLYKSVFPAGYGPLMVCKYF